ncbi:MAG: nucleotidyl transferase AbiEii/AbiGii toxin family protein [Planctomycetes bacterium]|nr:nucleotidyl transferase AbiEii/AbiGii toxin family protein [Planctomycetota bacterium]
MTRAAAFHPEVLPPEQLAALRSLAPILRRDEFYLGGGTAVALQLGHRRSIDLDWFTDRDLDPDALATTLRRSGVAIAIREVARQTLHAEIGGVPASFFSYSYAQMQKPINWQEVQCDVASIPDLAAMKLAALAQRGARKDFADVYAIARAVMPLREMMVQYSTKYQTRDLGHVLVALSYFDDAEREPPLEMIWPDRWEYMKTAIQSWTKDLAR